MSQNIHATQDWTIDTFGIIESKQGSNICLKDSVNASLQGLKVYGKTNQIYTKGNQLIPYPYKTTSTLINGVEIIYHEDGSITMSGRASKQVVIYLYDKANDKKHIELGKNYTLTGNWQGVGQLSLVANYYKTGATTNYSAWLSIISKNNSVVIEKKEAPSDMQGLIIYVTIAAGTTVNGTLYPMLNEGTVSLDFEPYSNGIVSPSLEYVQPFVNIGDKKSVNINFYGQNLFNPSSISTNTLNTSSIKPVLQNDWGTTLESSSNYNGVIKVKQTKFSNDFDGYYEGHYYNGVIYIGLYNYILELGKNYTFIADVNVTNILNGSPGFFAMGVNGPVKQVIRKNNKIYHNFTFESDVSRPDKRTIEFRCNGMSFELSNIMIVEGDVTNQDIEYTPYQEKQSLIIPTPSGLPGLPVANNGNYIDDNGQHWVCDEIDLTKGKYVQRIVKEVLDGSLDEYWQETIPTTGDQAESRYLMKAIGDNGYIVQNAILCDKYQKTSINSTAPYNIGINIIDSSGYKRTHIVLRPANAATISVSEWRTQLSQNPLTVLYALTKPNEIDLNEMNIETIKTYKPITNIYNDENAYVEVTYIADPKSYIDKKFAELQAAILSTGGNI